MGPEHAAGGGGGKNEPNRNQIADIPEIKTLQHEARNYFLITYDLRESLQYIQGQN